MSREADCSNSREVILDGVKSGDIENDEFVFINAELGANCGAAFSSRLGSFGIHPVVNDGNSVRWQSLVIDKGLANRIPDRDEPIPRGRHHSIKDFSFET